MGYYMRVFSKGRQAAKLSEIRERLARNGLPAQVLADEDEDEWETAVLAYPDGREFAAIERNPVAPDGLGAEELAEMMDEVSECEPASAADWVKAYLAGVETIYAFQVLSAADEGDGWAAIRTAMDACEDHAGGIRQADGEGFSNEEGFHVLWQFSDTVSGPWWMAVLDEAGAWVTYQMDLGNEKHRKAFKQGRVPDGVTISRPH
jgi:hypothetical protein